MKREHLDIEGFRTPGGWGRFIRLILLLVFNCIYNFRRMSLEYFRFPRKALRYERYCNVALDASLPILNRLVLLAYI